jgi:hypothetical protein
LWIFPVLFFNWCKFQRFYDTRFLFCFRHLFNSGCLLTTNLFNLLQVELEIRVVHSPCKSHTTRSNDDFYLTVCTVHLIG